MRGSLIEWARFAKIDRIPRDPKVGKERQPVIPPRLRRRTSRVPVDHVAVEIESGVEGFCVVQFGKIDRPDLQFDRDGVQRPGGGGNLDGARVVAWGLGVCICDTFTSVSAVHMRSHDKQKNKRQQQHWYQQLLDNCCYR